MLSRKPLSAAFWSLCTIVLLLKIVVFAGKGWLVWRHLFDWRTDALVIVAIIGIAVAFVWLCIRKLRQPASS